MPLEGVALVTGAGRGIGQHAAFTLAASGVRFIVCADLSLEAAAKTVAAVEATGDTKALALEIDVTCEESVVETFKLALSKSPNGRIDYFVNAAGSGPMVMTPITDMSLDAYRKMNDVHNLGTFLCLREMIKIMQEQVPRDAPLPGERTAGRSSRGSIVTLASLASKGAVPGAAGYIASKHAIEGLVQCAALENARSSIRINCISPTYVEDAMMRAHLDAHPDKREMLTTDQPLGRLVDPGEVSDAIVFLLSASSSYINGTNLVLDGGLHHLVGRPRFA